MGHTLTGEAKGTPILSLRWNLQGQLPFRVLMESLWCQLNRVEF